MMASINGAVGSLPDQRSWIETPCRLGALGPSPAHARGRTV